MNLTMLKFHRLKIYLLYILFFSLIFLLPFNVNAASFDDNPDTEIAEYDKLVTKSIDFTETDTNTDFNGNDTDINKDVSSDELQINLNNNDKHKLTDEEELSLDNEGPISLQYSIDSSTASDNTINIESTTENTTEEILKLLNSGSSTIHIPAGTYDFENTQVKLNKYTEIYGDGSDKTILKNICFIAKTGISLKDMSIDGGATINNLWTHYGEYSSFNIIILGNHTTTYNKFAYENVNFSNADFASFIKEGPTLKSDSATNCKFENIKKIAIYHTSDSLSSTFTYNTFKSIGDSSTSNGVVAAIFIGDICNITYTESNNCTIDHNTFEDLYTADDPDLNRHVLNGNFIAVRARRASITSNTISNVHGYGEDREAIYTKVMFLTVSDNTVANGGYGEGYITCKGQDGLNAFATITNNTLTGDYGSGIYAYGPSTIKNNTIEISNCNIAICHHARVGQTNNKVYVTQNTINSAMGHYIANGKVLNTTSTALIAIDGGQSAVSVQANTVNLVNTGINMQAVIKIYNACYDVTANSNTISTDIPNCVGLVISAPTTCFYSNKNAIVTVTGNNVTSPSLAIQIIYNNDGRFKTNRTFTLTKNKLNGSTTTKYGIYLNCGDNNNDVLNYSTPYKNNYLSNILYTNCKNINSTSNTFTLVKN